MRIIRMLTGIVFLALTISVSGADEVFSGGLSGSSLQAGTTVTVADPFFGMSSAVLPSYLTEKSIVEVAFQYDQKLMQQLPAGWYVNICYTLKLYNRDNSLLVTHSSQALRIGTQTNGSVSYRLANSYANNTPHQPNDPPQSYTYYKAVLTINSVQLSSGLNLANLGDLRLDVNIVKDRSYALSSQALPYPTHQYVSGSDSYTFAWPYRPGDVSYDFEWIFVENNPNQSAAEPEINWADANRVSTEMNFYELPACYSAGTLVYRVRAKGTDNYNSDPSNSLDGPWSCTATMMNSIPSGCKLSLSGKELNKNWAYSATYVEQGKRSEAMVIYDGLYKERQKIGISNTEQKAVVSETYYDYHGRAVVQSLPVMVNDKTLKHYPDFNPAFTPAAYDGDEKYKNPDAVSGSSLLGAFYSGTSTYLSSINSYLPSANGYPYMRTVTTPDPSGRPAMSTMAGANLKAGSEHETRTYYGTPTQDELDRLFGNNVGKAGYYSKEMVRDANGQTNVSYKDLQGRVIASAVTANTENSPYLAVDNAPQSSLISTNILENNPGQTDNLTVSKNIPVSQPGEYTFNYTLSPTEVRFLCPKTSMIQSLIPRYDVRFYITNLYGVRQPLIQVSGGTYDSNSKSISVSDASSGTVTFKASLGAGTYTVNKILVPNNTVINNYVSVNNNLTSCVEQPYIAPEPCPGNCEEVCTLRYRIQTSPTTYTYIDNDGNPTSYENAMNLIATCQQACTTAVNNGIITPKSECEIAYETMLTDMSPGGQYFDNIVARYNKDANGNYVLDANGDREENPNYAPDDFLDNIPCDIFSILDNHGYTQAHTWAALRANWQDSYAEYLVWYHPEYSVFYRHCVNACKDIDFLTRSTIESRVLYTSSEYDVEMMMQSNDAQAYDAGYFFPLNSTITQGANYNNPLLDQSGYHYVDDFSSNPTQTAYDPVKENNGCLLQNCTNTTMRDLVQSYLAHFMEVNTGVYYSIWYVMDDPSDIATNGNPGISTDAYNAILALHNPTNGLLNPSSPNHISKIQFFTGVYEYYKQYAIYNNLQCDASAQTTSLYPSCPGTSIVNPLKHFAADANGLSTGTPSILAAGFALRFPKNPAYEAMGCNCTGIPASVIPGLATFVNNQQAQTCASNCLDNLPIWKSKLQNCTLAGSYTFETDVRPALLAICEQTCNENNSYLGTDGNAGGASYAVPNTSPVIYLTNFQDVVNYFYTTGCTAPQHPVYDCQSRCDCERIDAMIDAIAQIQSIPVTSVTNTDIVNHLYNLTGVTYTTTDVANWRSACALPVYDEDDCSALHSALYTPTSGAPIAALLQCEDNSGTSWENFISQCQQENAAIAQQNTDIAYAVALSQYSQHLKDIYATMAIPELDGKETFTMEYSLGEYLYTLYYYDQAGTLVRTVPPEGVNMLTDLTGVRNHRLHPDDNNYPAVYPTHHMYSNYKYNSFQGPVEQYTPDGMHQDSQTLAYSMNGATTKFFYDDKARLVVSQNQKQYYHGPVAQYSFTQYDRYGRIVKTGQTTNSAAPYNTGGQQEYITYTNYLTWFGTCSNTEQVVNTQYDVSYSGIAALFGTAGQENINQRVASVMRDENNDGVYETAIHYSYDVHGNAKTVIRDLKALEPLGKRLNKMIYTYDLLSNNVLTMTALAGQDGEMTHRFAYDADNRLHAVYTTDKEHYFWTNEAKYYYYANGTLARTELGENQVQGIDNLYTINGWIRAFNSGIRLSYNDLGHDARVSSSNPNSGFGADVFALSLGYFDVTNGGVNNYKETVDPNVRIEPAFSDQYKSARKNLYNGNISWMVSGLSATATTAEIAESHVFRYDQLNRLKSDHNWTGLAGDEDWVDIITADVTFFNAYTYDFNGNLLTLQRNGNNPTTPEMDNLSYRYKTQSVGSTTRRSNNMLLSYSDLQSYASRYTDDVDGYGLAFDAADPGTWCYKYDEIGNLVQDKSEQIAGIEWDAYGKIKKITREQNSTKPDLEFIYDPMGTRVGKIEKPRTGGTLQNENNWQYTWYTHDAQGQTLATHSMSYEQAGTRYKAKYHTDEEYLFGSSRLGVLLTEDLPWKTREFNYSGYLSDGRFNITSWVDESITPVTPCQSHCVEAHVKTMGNRRYELKDHLGNVWATVSDVKSYSGGNFVAEIKSAQSYYPFGSLQPGRNFNAGDYRFGFNGQEMDNEVSGTGNSLTAEFWQYDSRLGRRWNIDPMSAAKPWMSPYHAFSNKPITNADPNGAYDEVVITSEEDIKNGNTTQTDLTVQEIQKAAPNLQISQIDGNVKYTGTPTTEYEIRLAEAIDDRYVKVELEATSNCLVDGDFHGSQVTDVITKTEEIDVFNNGHKVNFNYNVRMVTSNQTVNPSALAKDDKKYNGDPGQSIIHEITESYASGKYTQETGIDVSYYASNRSENIDTGETIYNPQYDLYEKFHSEATKQP